MCISSKYLAAATMLLAVTSIACAQGQPSAGLGSNASDVPGTSAAALGLAELTDEPSRSDLFALIHLADAATNPDDAKQAVEYFNLYGPFRFPNDVEVDTVEKKPRQDSLFGVDVSHYTSFAFPIEQLHTKKVRFVYIKATQGSDYLDPKFSNFWSRAGKLPKDSQVHRGAYHFLSCGDPGISAQAWGKAQAATFVKVIKANGGLLATDMPPVVDLEWDKAKANGPDRWAQRKPAEIIEMVRTFLSTVEAELHRKPMIYTAKSWWRERIGSEALFGTLSSYPLWLADYPKTARASEVPNSINGTRWALWQYTEKATMAIGFNEPFDANIFKGTTSSFYSSLGVAEFR
nr:GH25 family lysozyme [uncultured Ralstonia sp.]